MNPPSDENMKLWLIRHGETEWSLSGAHTSRTDIQLTERGKHRAAKIRDYLAQRKFSLVLASPLQRARETCRIAGYADVAQIEENLREWDYGIFEGRTTADIRKDQPDWSILDSPVPEGPAGRRRCCFVCPRPYPEDSGRHLVRSRATRGPSVCPGNRIGEYPGLRARDPGDLHLEPVIGGVGEE